MISDTIYLFNKYMQISLRAPLWLLFTLIQPLIWLIIFSELFGNMAQLPGFPEDSYKDFFVPGVLIMTVLFGSSWCGVSLLREIRSGTVDKMLTTPVSRAAIVLSRIMHSAVQVLAQTLIILATAWVVGASVHFHPLHLALGMVTIFFLGVGFAALSNGLAMTLQREEPLVVMGNLMTLPLMFFSSAMVPQQMMPEWIQIASKINPIEYATSAVRQSLSDKFDMMIYLKDTGILAIFCAVALIWSISAFNSIKD